MKVVDGYVYFWVDEDGLGERAVWSWRQGV